MSATMDPAAGPTPLDEAPPRALRVALLGFGTVGASVARILADRPELADRLELTHVFNRERRAQARGLGTRLGDLDGERRRGAGAASPDVVVEVMGGVDPARDWVTRALEQGASVVTANKMLLADARAGAAAAGDATAACSCGSRRRSAAACRSFTACARAWPATSSPAWRAS